MELEICSDNLTKIDEAIHIFIILRKKLHEYFKSLTSDELFEMEKIICTTSKFTKHQLYKLCGMYYTDISIQSISKLVSILIKEKDKLNITIKG